MGNVGLDSKWVKVARGIVFFLVGTAVLLYGYTDFRAQRDMLEGTTEVEATVVDTNIEKESGDGVDYSATVEFRYSYEGQNYTSDYLSPERTVENHQTRDGAEEFLSTYEVGSNVTAYVNPDRPGKAFLSDHISLLVLFIGGFFGGIFCFVGLVSAVYYGFRG